jgi:hypothetical protein
LKHLFPETVDVSRETLQAQKRPWAFNLMEVSWKQLVVIILLDLTEQSPADRRFMFIKESCKAGFVCCGHERPLLGVAGDRSKIHDEGFRWLKERGELSPVLGRRSSQESFQGLVERPIAVEMKFTKEFQPPQIGIVNLSLQSHERVRVLADCSDQISEATRGPRILVDEDIEP